MRDHQRHAHPQRDKICPKQQKRRRRSIYSACATTSFAILVDASLLCGKMFKLRSKPRPFNLRLSLSRFSMQSMKIIVPSRSFSKKYRLCNRLIASTIRLFLKDFASPYLSTFNVGCRSAHCVYALCARWCLRQTGSSTAELPNVGRPVPTHFLRWVYLH